MLGEGLLSLSTFPYPFLPSRGLKAIRRATLELYEAIDAELAKRATIREAAREQHKKMLADYRATIQQRIVKFRRWQKKHLRTRLWKGAKYRHYFWMMQGLRRRWCNIFVGAGLFN